MYQIVSKGFHQRWMYFNKVNLFNIQSQAQTAIPCSKEVPFYFGTDTGADPIKWLY